MCVKFECLNIEFLSVSAICARGGAILWSVLAVFWGASAGGGCVAEYESILYCARKLFGI